MNERLRSAIASAVTSSLRWRAASSFCALSTSRLAFAPSSAARGRGLAGLGGGQGGDGAVAVGGGLLKTLLRAEIGLRELERAVIFQSAARSTSASALLTWARRRIDLGLGLRDDRALGVDLAGEAGDGRVLRADARSGRVDGVLIVAIVDRSEQVALVDDLVVHHRNRGQVAHRLGGDDRGVGADIGVVGRNEEAPVDEIVVSRFAAVAERGEDQNRA